MDRRTLKSLVLAAIAIAAVKLVLVSHNEIIAIPNDSAGFVRLVLAGVGQLGPPIGYPLWLRAVQQTGIPQRIAIELLYCLACTGLVLSLYRRIGFSLSLLALLALVLSPATYFLFDNALNDPLFLCLTLVGISISVLILDNAGNNEAKHYLFWTGSLGVVLGAMAVTRNEHPLTVAWIAWLALLVFLRATRENSTPVAAKAAAKKAFAIVVVFYAVSVIPNAYHYATKGVWTSGIATMPSHMELLHRLASIDTGTEDAKYVAVSMRARHLAYEASPTLASLKPFIERSDNMYVRASHDAGGLSEGEIGSGWVWHVFNDAAIQAMQGEKTPLKLDALWRQASKEIDAAFDSGRLRKRFVIHPLLGAGIATPFSNFPKSMLAVLETSFRFVHGGADAGFDAEAFDSVCNRRASLVVPQTEIVRFQGWGLVDLRESKLARIQSGYLDLRTGKVSWSDLDLVSRTDVSTAFSPKLGRSIEAWGFRGELLVPKGTQVMLRYGTNKGEVLDKTLVPNKVQKAALPEGPGALYTGLDSVERSSGRVDTRRFHSTLSKVVEWRGWQSAKSLFAFVLVTPLVLLLGFRRLPSLAGSATYFMCVFVAGLAVQRLAFYALIHERAWSVDNEPRYLASLFDMSVIVFVCLVAVVVPWLAPRASILASRVAKLRAKAERG